VLSTLWSSTAAGSLVPWYCWAYCGEIFPQNAQYATQCVTSGHRRCHIWIIALWRHLPFLLIVL